MIRLLSNGDCSNSSLFAACMCPHVKRSVCQRPYCPFNHLLEVKEEIIVLEDDEEEKLLNKPNNSQYTAEVGVSSDVASLLPAMETIPPLVRTEIIQESHAATFTGGYVAQFGSTTNSVIDQHQQNPIFLHNSQPTHFSQDQFPASSHNQQYFHPATLSLNAPAFNEPELTISSMDQHRQYPTTNAAILDSHMPSTIQFPVIDRPNISVARQSLTSNLAAQQQKEFSKRHKPRTKPTPGGLPTYIPTPIAQLEKEQNEKMKRQARKEQKQAERRREAEEEGIVEHKKRRVEIDERKAERENTENEETRVVERTGKKAKKAVQQSATDLDIDRLFADQEHMLDELFDTSEHKIREKPRIEKKLTARTDKSEKVAPVLAGSRPQHPPPRVPMHHPSQRPAAPKLISTLTNPSGSSSVSTTLQQPMISKGKVRTAHVPKHSIGISGLQLASSVITKSNKQLVPLDSQNRKVPLFMRQRNLYNIHKEYTKICVGDPEQAIEGAQLEEKAVMERCNGKMGYLAAIPMLIKRLREAAANGGGATELRCGQSRKSSTESISHSSNLLGRHVDSVTCGLNRSAHHRTSALSELDFYTALSNQYLLTDQQLWENGYPQWAKQNNEMTCLEDESISNRLVEIRQSELDAGKSRVPFVDDCVLSRVCDRCGKEYRLTREGNYAPGASSEQCIFHWGKAWKKRISGTVESRYQCCDQPLGVPGCDVAPNHITQTLRMCTLRQYAETPRPFGVGDPRSKKVYSLDCEMVYSIWGPEVARVSIVDITGELVLDIIVRPEHLLIDCNTKFSGLRPEQVLAGECNLKEAHQRVFELVNAETILIGHSLESDLRSLRLIHRRVVDTSVVFPHRMGPPLKRALRTLASELIQQIIQEDESGHDSKEDALACMRIMLRKVKGA